MNFLPDISAVFTGIPDLLQLGVWLTLAFSLGLVHAFDADHVMALSVFATGERGGGRRGMRAGLSWSLGHGIIVLLAGLALFLLGHSMPDAWTGIAERCVGLVMVGLGVSVFADLYRRQRHARVHAHFHTHDGLVPHAHWHSHERNAQHPSESRHRHEHAPSLVGALHGLAGSAPILALLPAAAKSPAVGLAYLVLFGLGVAVAMAVVSGALGHLVARLSNRAQNRTLSGVRAVSGAGSIMIGLWLGVGV